MRLKKFTPFNWQMNAATTSHNHHLCQGAISLHRNFHLDPFNCGRVGLTKSAYK